MIIPELRSLQLEKSSMEYANTGHLSALDSCFCIFGAASIGMSSDSSRSQADPEGTISSWTFGLSLAVSELRPLQLEKKCYEQNSLYKMLSVWGFGFFPFT